MIKYGATNYKDIKNKMEIFKSEWSETEIRLRICRLLKCYNLKVYDGVKFTCKEDILEEALRNKEEAVKQKKICGGIFYNPPAELDDGIMSSYFNIKNKQQQQSQSQKQ